jgi:hypothetical protein
MQLTGGKPNCLQENWSQLSLRLSQFSVEWPGMSRNLHPYSKGDSFNNNLFTGANTLGNLNVKVTRNRPEGPEGVEV